MMNDQDIKKIAKMAKIYIPESELAHYRDINDILTMIEQMDKINTDAVEAMSHPLEIIQRLRDDTITEHNERTRWQKVASNVEAGIYLVPQVFDQVCDHVTHDTKE